VANDGLDYDVIVIGSDFGGSVAALRAVEKGYRVGVLEAGRRWNDEDLPHTNSASRASRPTTRTSAAKGPAAGAA
jgi:choline dehydrogenase-like flavoprotein